MLTLKNVRLEIRNFYKGAKMAKRYGNSKSSSVNQKPDKFNDQHYSDKDSSQGGFLRGMTAAQQYMGMPTSMRSGLEEESMIHEDHRAIANLPQEVMIKPYPRTGPYLPEDLDDTIRGVDAQMDYDDSQRRAHFYPKKV